MQTLIAPHVKSALCRCQKCARDRVVLSAVSGPIASALRQAISAPR